MDGSNGLNIDSSLYDIIFLSQWKTYLGMIMSILRL